MPWSWRACRLAPRVRLIPAGQYVDALNKGDTHLLETVWPGEVVVYDPRSGEVRGHWRLRQFVRQSQSWLAERHARVETAACTVAGDTIQSFPSFWDLRHGTDGALHGDHGHPVARQAAGRADAERAPVSRTARDCRS